VEPHAGESTEIAPMSAARTPMMIAMMLFGRRVNG
jgi:hypothetical protein